jgi:integrase
MPGSIVRRGNSYVLKLYAGREGGKKRDKWLTFKSYGEAQAAQGELASHVLAHAAGVGLYGSPRERTGPYLADWLKRQKSRLAPKTFTWYEIIVEQIKQDALGTIPLGRLSPRALEAYYERKRESGLSTTTVLHHHRLVHKALKDAERQDLILKNPASSAQAPKRARVRLEIWTEAQILLFLSEAKSRSPNYPLYLFLVGTGVRVGEAMGLTWRDVALGDGVVCITQALQRNGGGGYTLAEPKTANSRRTITLPPEVAEELRRVLARQRVERKKRGDCETGVQCTRPRCKHWHPLDLVFCQPNGQPLHVHNLRQGDLRRLCKKLGLPYHRALHNMRHGHGSYLLQRGVSVKVVQERLGHSTAAFTLSTYTHVLTGMQAHAAEAISAMLRGKAGS